jgi:hypothetical protein
MQFLVTLFSNQGTRPKNVVRMLALLAERCLLEARTPWVSTFPCCKAENNYFKLFLILKSGEVDSNCCELTHFSSFRIKLFLVVYSVSCHLIFKSGDKAEEPRPEPGNTGQLSSDGASNFQGEHWSSSEHTN